MLNEIIQELEQAIEKAQASLKRDLAKLRTGCVGAGRTKRLSLGRPEVIITFAGQKFDDKLELKEQGAIDLIKQQLAGFEKLIRKVHPVKTNSARSAA